MSERVFLKTAFTPAGAQSLLRNQVSGFLRYIQHRDQHPGSREARLRPDVSGLVKYVAYRDRASSRAELFGPSGTANSAERKAFAAFVTTSLEKSRPQLFRGRDGRMHDRRRAVHRMIFSPERAEGLDLRRLLLAGTTRLEQDCGGSLRWLAAIHRNTDHHHIHFVLAGMRQDATGRFVRVEITKRRLAALKEAIALEVERQRGERTPSHHAEQTPARTQTYLAAATHAGVPAIRSAASTAIASSQVRRGRYPRSLQSTQAESLIALRAVARRYQRRMQRELEAEARRQCEHAA